HQAARRVGSSAGPERAEVRVDPRGERRGCGQPRRRWRGLDRFAGGQGGGIEEPGELPVTVPVVAGEPVVVQPHRRVQVEVVARPGARDVEQPLFLGEPGRGAQRHVAGHRTVDQVGQVHHGPFQPLGRVHGGDDQEVLVVAGRPGEVRGRYGRGKRPLDGGGLQRGAGRGRGRGPVPVGGGGNPRGGAGPPAGRPRGPG